MVASSAVSFASSAEKAAGRSGLATSAWMRAVAATRHATAWLVLPADLPLVQPDTLLQVAKALQTHTVVVPSWQGERGHPVGFAASCRPELLALTGDSGARAVVQHYGAHLLAVQDAGCVHDVDTPQALEEARQRLG